MKLRSRRAAWVVALFLLLGLGAFYPIPMGHKRDRIASALSAALDRRVTFSDAHMHLLPTPGLVIDGPFVVEDDPAFSAEPLLRAESVKAGIRLASIWRGRWEIASVFLDSPNINLVRSDSGHWNLESLVLRASQTPTAPTSKARAETQRLRFPYIEVNDARINLKLGLLKSVYALTETEASLWLESDDRWNVRLKGKPVRTDVPISDTGALSFRGRVGRAPSIGQIPFEGIAEIADAQLGQLSKLIVGRDAGWRGSLQAELSARGTLGALHVASKMRVEQFRRYDVANEDAIALSTDCSGDLLYSMLGSFGQRTVETLSCTSKLGNGELLVAGKVGKDYAVTVTAKNVPLSGLASIYRNVQPNVPPDLRGGGTLEGSFAFSADRLSGSGSVRDLRLSSAVLKAPLELREPLILSTQSDGGSIASSGAEFPGIGTASLSATTHDYEFRFRANGDLPQLVAVGQAFGIATPFHADSGHAQGSVLLHGNWFGFSRPQATADLALTEVTAGSGDRRTVLHAAQLTVAPERAILANIEGEMPAAKLLFFGDVGVSRPCAFGIDCAYSVKLRSPLLDTAAAAKALAPERGILSGLLPSASIFDQFRSPLKSLQVDGTVSVSRVVLPRRELLNATADFKLRGGVLAVKNLTANLDGGQLLARDSTVDLNAEPAYNISAGLVRVPFSSLVPSASGIMNAQLQITMRGANPDALKQSAQGTVRFELLNGVLSSAVARFPFRRLIGAAEVANQKVTLQDGATAVGPAGANWHVSGSADLAHTLNVQFTRGTDRLEVIGPLVSASNNQ